MGNIEKFDSMANQYDSTERATNAKIIADEIRRHIGCAFGKTAIDYGCGTGLVGLNLLDLFVSILFIDAAPKMVEVMKQKLVEFNVTNAKALCFDFETERALDIRADYVIVAQTLLHIKDTKQVLSRLHSLLNAGGHLIIVDFDKTEGIESPDIHHGFEQSDLIDIALKLGFRKAIAHTFYKGENILAGKDTTMFLLDALK